MFTFDIIIPTYNNKDELLWCLASLEGQTFTDFRVLVCVNGSTDGTLEALAALQTSFQVLVLEHPDKQNHGRPANRNLGISNLDAPFTLLLDSDQAADKNLVLKHHELLSKQDCISVGEVIYQQKNDWNTYIASRGKGKFTDLTHIPFQYLNTQNVALKSTYLQQVGGFDEQIQGYGGDDTELAYRLWQKFQLPVIYNQKAFSNDDQAKSVNQALVQMYDFGANNLPYIHQKHPEFKEIFNVALLKNKVVNTFLVNGLLYNSIKNIYPIFPSTIKNTCIHYLVFYNICKGFNGVKD